MSQGRLSDDRLARAAAHGEPDAFGQIYARYHGPVYGYCLSILQDPDEARDALQNTMEKALGAIGTQQVTGGLKAWLFGIAHNEAISLTRRRPATQPISDELALAAAPSDPADRERLAQLVHDLKTLPERQRSALVMRELAGLGSAEIGSALGISPSAANQAVYEARATLLAQSGGRDMDCRQVQTKLSDSDGRIRRGRRLKAHLADCALCTAFAAAIPGRTADMRMVFGPLGATLAAETLAAATAGGVAGGGAAGAASGGAGHGAAAASKGGTAHLTAAGSAAAVIAAVVIGALALGSPESDPTDAPVAEAAPAAPAKQHAKAAKAPAATQPAAQTKPAAAVTGYSDLGSGVLGTLGGAGAGGANGSAQAASAVTAGSDGGNSLPFTGMDLMLLALAGAALLGTGAGLRHLARAPRL